MPFFWSNYLFNTLKLWACSELIAKDCGLQRSLFHHTCWNIRAITLKIDCTAKLALCYKFWRELIVLEQVFFSGQISWWLTRFQRPGGLLSLGLVLVFSGWWSVGTRMCDNTAPPTKRWLLHQRPSISTTTTQLSLRASETTSPEDLKSLCTSRFCSQTLLSEQLLCRGRAHCSRKVAPSRPPALWEPLQMTESNFKPLQF